MGLIAAKPQRSGSHGNAGPPFRTPPPSPWVVLAWGPRAILGLRTLDAPGIKRMPLLHIRERLQAGDAFLLKLDCPRCQHEHLTGYPLETLPCCGLEVGEWELDIKHARVLSGTRRPGRIKKSDIRWLLGIQGPHCAYCRDPFSETSYHVEHIVPLSAGGTSRLDNLCLACPPCNKTAGSKIFGTFQAKTAYVLARRGR